MTGFFPTNQNTLYLLRLFYSDNEIITVCGRPAICTLIGWFKNSRLFISLFGFCDWTLLELIMEKFSSEWSTQMYMLKYLIIWCELIATLYPFIKMTSTLGYLMEETWVYLWRIPSLSTSYLIFFQMTWKNMSMISTWKLINLSS